MMKAFREFFLLQSLVAAARLHTGFPKASEESAKDGWHFLHMTTDSIAPPSAEEEGTAGCHTRAAPTDSAGPSLAEVEV